MKSDKLVNQEKMDNETLFVIKLFNTLNTELNPIYYLLALLGAHHILHVSRISVKFQSQHSKLC